MCRKPISIRVVNDEDFRHWRSRFHRLCHYPPPDQAVRSRNNQSRQVTYAGNLESLREVEDSPRLPFWVTSQIFCILALHLTHHYFQNAVVRCTIPLQEAYLDDRGKDHPGARLRDEPGREQDLPGAPEDGGARCGVRETDPGAGGLVGGEGGRGETGFHHQRRRRWRGGGDRAGAGRGVREDGRRPRRSCIKPGIPVRFRKP